MVREAGLDLRCGGGRVAALGCPRQPIHFRSRSSPALFMAKNCGPQKGFRSYLVREAGLEPARA